MDIAVLTIFPELFEPFWSHGIIRRAVQGGRIVPATLNIRDFAAGKHKVTDDRPFGGGAGMVMKPEPLAAAIRAAKAKSPASPTILLSPQGKVFDQGAARQLAALEGIILVCGRYEGVDERIGQEFIDYEVSIGNFILTGGELAAMVLIDAIARLIPGVLGNEDSAQKDTFCDDLLEHDQYTRPSTFEGRVVPEILLSGHHAQIEQWRLEQTLIRTFLKRPDLLRKRTLTAGELAIMTKWRLEIENIVAAQPVCGPDPLPGEG
jgi:tRNA (guanine37-N1)-methyltransferase